ncbi:AAA family ATPase [Senegalia massiliensis]|uniref:Rad50/SbcC-type AAA domain-containing protein n=1 Tax=Senegalia massiliensis TaxID=1720316 RepID=A0A845QYQ4_9CLOT|nr:AAA family ATPase [Senegalia massiliensis]NBI07615.1 hypothetical protein [Senegalia massiliensis]
MSDVQDINLLELIEETTKEYGKNNKFKYGIAENFECHKYTHIEFSDCMTTFVGESSNGKSSFMRMLDWVQYNSLRGDKHITTGERECRGIIGTINGFEVKREITPSHNRYYITHKSWEQEFILEGFGVNVPLEVSAVLGAFKVKIDDKKNNDLKINYMEQGSGWFLTSDQYTSTTKAKAVSLLYGVHFLDQSIKDTKVELNKVNKNISGNEEEIESLKLKLKQYDYLDDLKARIDKVQALYDRQVKLKTLSEKVKELNTKYIKVCYEYNKSVKLLEQININNIDGASNLIKDIAIKLNKANNLVRLDKGYSHSTKEINNADRVINEGLKLDDIDELINNISQSTNNLKILIKLNEDYVVTNRNIKTENDILKIEDNNNKANTLLNNATEKFNLIANTIPLINKYTNTKKKIGNANLVIKYSPLVSKLDGNIEKANSLIYKLNNLNSVTQPYKVVDAQLDKIRRILDESKDINKLSKRYKDATRDLNKANTLIPLKNEYNTIKAKIENTKPFIQQEDKLNRIDDSISKINNLFRVYEGVFSLKKEIMNKNKLIDEEDVTIKEKLNDLNNSICKYEEIIKQIGVCPLCRSEINDNVVDHLIVELNK